MTSHEAKSASSVAQAFFAALGGGDVAAAARCWAGDAVWHVTGNHDRARDYDFASYLELLGQWTAEFPDYQPEFKGWRDVGDEVAVVEVESTGGTAPGTATGLMIYRVVDGVIVEGWAIPTFAAGRFVF